MGEVRTEQFPPAHCTPEEKAKVRLAAALRGISMSELIRQAALGEATNIVEAAVRQAKRVPGNLATCAELLAANAGAEAD